MNRTWIGEVESVVGQEVNVKGWVNSLRIMGDKLVFVDLRDASGLVQTVIYKPDLSEEIIAEVSKLKTESVVSIVAVVQKRGEKQIKTGVLNGSVELSVKNITVLQTAETLPFEINQDTRPVNEELRLAYRYLDLRSERLQKNIRLRSQLVQAWREALFNERFVEIETPLLSQATPEGSRDFIVPSRLQPGHFFALPQSPQQYKQLLMVGGFERYFQIARCMRDEDPRADRGFEFTQLDIEMSFVEREDVMQTVEKMVTDAAEKLGFIIKQKPFPRFSYAEAMETYGADKFDLRTEEEKAAGNILAYAWVIDFPFFEKDEKTGRWTFTHNPFSAPLPEFKEDHLAGRNIENILTSQYDLVCNGYESGGGSIRAHEPEALRATYKIMGYTEQETEDSVGHMIKAFSFGAPPHGGIALGVERNVMNLTGETALKEVQAFPMTGSGRTSVMKAPTVVDDQTLSDLHIQVTAKKETSE